MFERYTEEARLVLFRARFEAQQSGSGRIEPEHLFLALAVEDPVRLRQLLPAVANVESICREVRDGLPSRDPHTEQDMPLSHPAKRVLAYGAEEAHKLGHRHIGNEHHLLGLLREPSSVSRILETYGVRLEQVRQQILDSAPGTAET